MSETYCRCPPCQAAIALGERRLLGRRTLSRCALEADGTPGRAYVQALVLIGRSEFEESGVFVCTAALRKIAKLGCELEQNSAESAASD
jgi:hypothetical protein